VTHSHIGLGRAHDKSASALKRLAPAHRRQRAQPGSSVSRGRHQYKDAGQCGHLLQGPGQSRAIASLTSDLTDPSGGQKTQNRLPSIPTAQQQQALGFTRRLCSQTPGARGRSGFRQSSKPHQALAANPRHPGIIPLQRVELAEHLFARGPAAFSPVAPCSINIQGSPVRRRRPPHWRRRYRPCEPACPWPSIQPRRQSLT